MKKYFIGLFYLVFCCSIVYAEDSLNTVFLDIDYSERNTYKDFSPKIDNLNIQKEDELNEDYIYHPLKYIKDEAGELYSKKTISNTKEKKHGKATLGVKHDTTLSPENLTQKRTLYSKYNLTEKMSINADYQTNSSDSIEAQTKGAIGIGPEYQVNRKLKLKNKYTKDLNNNSNKGEVSVEIKPFNNDRFDFNAGAAQIQQENGDTSRSQVNFGTNFKF